ncbi:MAG: hypothetical protein QXU18_06715 [Thermoplasmatales archaeon]
MVTVSLGGLFMGIKLNWFRLTPSKDLMKIWKLDTSNTRINPNRIVNIMNNNPNSFTSVIQTNDYLNFTKGLYFITPFQFENEIKEKLTESLNLDTNLHFNSHEVSNYSLEVQSINSQSFIAGRILHQRMRQYLLGNQGEFEYAPKIGTGNLIEITIPIPQENDPFFRFADCREFFSIGKSLELLIQHDFDSLDGNYLYLVGRVHHRRISSLGLERVLLYLSTEGIDTSELVGVVINHHPSNANNSQVCHIATIGNGYIVLKDTNNREFIETNFKSVELNQTFEKTRNFIERKLCGKFEECEKWMRDKNKTWPTDSLKITTTAIASEFRSIVEESMKEFEVTYSLNFSPAEVEK